MTDSLLAILDKLEVLPRDSDALTIDTGFAKAADALAFMLGGNARVTFRSKKTGDRFTYRIAVCDGKPDLFFVAVLTGPDNTSSFQYLGTIRRGFAGDRYAHGVKSRIGADAPSARGFAWVWAQLQGGGIPSAVEIWHEGRCGRCARPLTVPESIRTGFGSECAGKLGF